MNNKYLAYGLSKFFQRFVEVNVYHVYQSMVSPVIIEDNYETIMVFEDTIELDRFMRTFELGIRIAKRLHPKVNKKTLLLKAYEYGKRVQLANYETNLNPRLTVGGNNERYRMLKVKGEKSSSVFNKLSYEDNRTFHSRFELISDYVFNAYQRKAKIMRLTNR